MSTGLTYFGRSEAANVPLLDKKLRRQSWYKTFWGRFAAPTVAPEKRPSLIDMPAPTNAIVTVSREFVSEGRDEMIIPMLSRIGDAGKYGDSQLTGFAAKMTIKYLHTYINQVRQAVSAQAGRMSNQKVKALRLVEKAQPILSEWIADWNNTYGLTHALYWGFSHNITAPVSLGGLGFTGSDGVSSHPHIFYCDGTSATIDKVAHSSIPGSAGYETLVSTAVTSLTDTAADHMDTGVLEALKVRVQELRIVPIYTKGGNKFWVLVLHPNQIKQLRADSAWVAANGQAYVQNLVNENPIFRGAAGFYAGFAIFEDITIVQGATALDADNVRWGSADWLNTLDTSPRKFGIVLGRNALARGVALDPYFTSEVFDHQNQKEVGAAMIVGDRRADFDIGGTVYNDSSCLIGTYSP